MIVRVFSYENVVDAYIYIHVGVAANLYISF